MHWLPTEKNIISTSSKKKQIPPALCGHVFFLRFLGSPKGSVHSSSFVIGGWVATIQRLSRYRPAEAAFATRRFDSDSPCKAWRRQGENSVFWVKRCWKRRVQILTANLRQCWPCRKLRAWYPISLREFLKKEFLKISEVENDPQFLDAFKTCTGKTNTPAIIQTSRRWPSGLIVSPSKNKNPRKSRNGKFVKFGAFLDCVVGLIFRLFVVQVG